MSLTDSSWSEDAAEERQSRIGSTAADREASPEDNSTEAHVCRACITFCRTVGRGLVERPRSTGKNISRTIL